MRSTSLSSSATIARRLLTVATLFAQQRAAQALHQIERLALDLVKPSMVRSMLSLSSSAAQWIPKARACPAVFSEVGDAHDAQPLRRPSPDCRHRQRRLPSPTIMPTSTNSAAASAAVSSLCPRLP